MDKITAVIQRHMFENVSDLKNAIFIDGVTLLDYITVNGEEYMMVEYSSASTTHPSGKEGSRWITYADKSTFKKEIYIDMLEETVEEEEAMVDWKAKFGISSNLKKKAATVPEDYNMKTNDFIGKDIFEKKTDKKVGKIIDGSEVWSKVWEVEGEIEVDPKWGFRTGDDLFWGDYYINVDVYGDGKKILPSYEYENIAKLREMDEPMVDASLKKESGTWAIPYTEAKARKLLKIYNEIKPLPHNYTKDDLYSGEGKEQLEQDLSDVFGDDRLFDDIDNDKIESGIQLREIIRKHVHDLVEYYKESPENFSDTFEDGALVLLESILSPIRTETSLKKQSDENTVYQCLDCKTKFTGSKWGRKFNDPCPICRSRKPFKETKKSSLDKKAMRCPDCFQEMSSDDIDSCIFDSVVIGGEILKRDTSYFDVNDRCHDCNIANKEGNIHHFGCDMERCPKCDGQIISCECKKDFVVNTSTDEKKIASLKKKSREYDITSEWSDYIDVPELEWVYTDNATNQSYEDDGFIHVIRDGSRFVFYNGQDKDMLRKKDIPKYEKIVDKAGDLRYPESTRRGYTMDNMKKDATGEMSERDIAPGGEDYGWALAIKRSVERLEQLTGGFGEIAKVKFISIEPFDKYQGPYARVTINSKNDKIWSAGEEGTLFIENLDISGDPEGLAKYLNTGSESDICVWKSGECVPGSDQLELPLKESTLRIKAIMKKKSKKTLEDWRDVIEREVEFVDVKPYSHNIISIALSAIKKDHGKDKANKAMEDFGLESLGWRKVSNMKKKSDGDFKVGDTVSTDEGFGTILEIKEGQALVGFVDDDYEETQEWFDVDFIVKEASLKKTSQAIGDNSTWVPRNVEVKDFECVKCFLKFKSTYSGQPVPCPRCGNWVAMGRFAYPDLYKESSEWKMAIDLSDISLNAVATDKEASEVGKKTALKLKAVKDEEFKKFGDDGRILKGSLISLAEEFDNVSLIDELTINKESLWALCDEYGIWLETKK